MDRSSYSCCPTSSGADAAFVPVPHAIAQTTYAQAKCLDHELPRRSGKRNVRAYEAASLVLPSGVERSIRRGWTCAVTGSEAMDRGLSRRSFMAAVGAAS